MSTRIPNRPVGRAVADGVHRTMSVVLLGLALACSSQTTKKSGCTAGDQRTCTGANGCSGVRVCDATGAFGPCDCGGNDGGAGTGGSAGSAGSGGASGAGGFLNGWSHRIPVNVDNAGSVLSGQQLLLVIDAVSLIAAKRLAPDASDLRVTTADNQLLPHWVETGLVKETRVWIRADVPAGASQLFVYSGNAAAGDTQEPESVFEFFDDFAGAALDGSKWSLALQTGTAGHQVSGGMLRLFSGGGTATFPFDSVQIVAQPVNGPRIIGTELNAVNGATVTHTEIVWRASASGHWLNNGRWIYARFHTFNPFPELTMEVSTDAGGQNQTKVLGAGGPTTRFHLLRDGAGSYSAFVDGALGHTFDTSGAGWTGDDAIRPSLSAGNNFSVPLNGVPAYDYRYSWFFTAKPTPGSVSLSYGPVEAAP